ncbi:MAG: Uma2 family endonuclease [Dehalococcoidia bacterium]
MEPPHRLLTAAEFAEFANHVDEPLELVRGRVVPKHADRPNYPAIIRISAARRPVLANLVARLEAFVEAARLGPVITNARAFDDGGPDVAFISFARLGSDTFGADFVPMAPDLAVEVISPSETAADMENKVAEYFAAGGRRVWLVWPERREITVRRPDGTATTHGIAATLTSDDAAFDAPGFSLPLATIFG